MSTAASSSTFALRGISTCLSPSRLILVPPAIGGVGAGSGEPRLAGYANPVLDIFWGQHTQLPAESGDAIPNSPRAPVHRLAFGGDSLAA